MKRIFRGDAGKRTGRRFSRKGVEGAGKTAFRGWIIKTLVCLLMLLAWAGIALGESAGEIIIGYFENSLYLRPAMEQTMQYVDVVPAYTIVTLEKVNETWAVCTGPKGETGYVKYKKILPVPEYERDEEYYVFSEDRVQVRSLPIYNSAIAYTTQADELLTVDGHYKGYIHVLASDGTGGYVIPEWVRRADFTPRAITPVTLCVAEETEVTDMPLRGAHVQGTLKPEEFYVADGSYGVYYALELEGNLVYVEKNRTAICTAKKAQSRTFFSLPRAGGVRRKDRVENVYTSALIRQEGATLHLAGGKTRELTGEDRLYLYSAWGLWYGAVYQNQAGYILREDVEVLTAEVMMARLRELDLSGGSIQRNEFLDQAFAMLEAGNPFQARYNLLTGAEIESLFPLGVPYFWGGRSYRVLTERLPKYTTREAWQSSPVYYHQGTIYLYGFDCTGFVKAVYSLVGKPIEVAVSGLRDAVYCETGQHIYCDDVHPLPEDWTEVARNLQVGDILQIHHPGNHVMLYMGTLRDYGYTEKQLPALAKYLDNPLMLQSGENHYSYFRFKSLIETSDDGRVSAATPPDGGVGVCILGVPREEAEMVLEAHEATSYCFDVEGSCVTIMYFGNVKDYFVWRWTEEASEVPAGEGTELDESEAIGDEEMTEVTDNPEEIETESPVTPGAETELDEADAVKKEDVPEIGETLEVAGTENPTEKKEPLEESGEESQMEE